MGQGLLDSEVTEVEPVGELVPEPDMLNLDEVEPTDTTDGSTDILEPVEENESVEESVRKVVEAEKKKQTEGTQDQEGANSSPKATNQVQEGQLEPKQKGRFPKKKEIIPDLGNVDVPARLNAQEKELWKGVPNEFKPAIARLIRDHEAQESRRHHQHVAAVREAQGIVEAVRPYYVSNPYLAEKGITEQKFVSSMVANHQQLMNPKTSKAKLAQIAESLGHNIKFVDQNGQVEEEFSSGAESTVISQLRNEINSLKSSLEEQKSSQAATPHIQAVERVQQAKDNQGNLIYPEASSREALLDLKPLVSEYVRRGQDYGTALVNAIQFRRYQNGSHNGTHSPQTKVQTNQQKQTVTPMPTARAKSTPSGIPTEKVEAENGSSIEDDIAAVVERLKRGVPI